MALMPPVFLSIKECRIIAPSGSLESYELYNALFCFRNSLKVRKEKDQTTQFLKYNVKMSEACPVCERILHIQ